MSTHPIPRAPRLLLTTAAVWSALLIVGALTLPAYTGGSSVATSEGGVSSPAPPVITSTMTIVQANGWKALVPVGFPLAATIVAAALLMVSGRHGWAWTAAWAPVALTAVLAVLGMLTIGIFVAPAAILLALATALTPRGTARPSTRHLP